MSAPEIDLAVVKATAEAARSGEWQAKGNRVIAKWAHGDHDVAIAAGSLPEGNVLNALHTATMDPSITLALVERLERAEREVDRLREALTTLEGAWSVCDDDRTALNDELGHSRDILGAYLSAWSGAIPVSWARTLRPHAAGIPLDGAFVVLDQHLNLLDSRQDPS